MAKKSDNRLSKDELADYLRTLEGAGRVITPDRVVKDARDPASPLHHYFIWDDAKAAHQNRLDTARNLIASCEYQITNELRTIKSVAYTRHPAKPAHEQGYIAVEALRTEPDLARDAVVREFAIVAAALRRARDLAAALGLSDEIQALATNVERVRLMVERPAEGGVAV